MLQNRLKSSVSLAVVLGALSTFTPSQAMENREKEEKQSKIVTGLHKTTLDELRETAKKTAYEVHTFLKSVKDPDNHELSLQKSLQTPQQLALIESLAIGESVLTKLASSENALNYPLLLQEYFITSKQQASSGNLFTEFQLRKIENDLGKTLKQNVATFFLSIYPSYNYKKEIGALALKPIVDYIFASFPALQQGWRWHYYSLLKTEQKATNSPLTFDAEHCAFIDEEYNAANKNDLPLLVTLAGNYRDADSYDKTMKILQDTLDKVGDSPFRFEILFEMANTILIKKDMDHLETASQYISEMREAFTEGEDELDTQFILQAIADEEPINFDSTLDLINVDELNIALLILKGEFEEAYQYLQGTNFCKNADEFMDAVDSEALMVAIDAQINNLPNDLKECFQKYVFDTYFDWSGHTLESRAWILQYPRLFLNFTAGNPKYADALKHTCKILALDGF